MVSPSVAFFNQVFSSTESEIRSLVALATLVMVLGLVIICCVSSCCARSVSRKIAEPVNQLVNTVRGLNRRDFSQRVCARALCVLAWFHSRFGLQLSTALARAKIFFEIERGELYPDFLGHATVRS